MVEDVRCCETSGDERPLEISGPSSSGVFAHRASLGRASTKAKGDDVTLSKSRHAHLFFCAQPVDAPACAANRLEHERRFGISQPVDNICGLVCADIQLSLNAAPRALRIDGHRTVRKLRGAAIALTPTP